VNFNLILKNNGIAMCIGRLITPDFQAHEGDKVTVEGYWETENGARHFRPEAIERENA
jgi:hypothetical protein